MPYQDLGFRNILGVSDATFQINPYLLGTGWDVILDAGALASNVPLIEIYQIALDGPVGSIFVMMRDGKPFNWVNQGWTNYYDPSQPILLPSTATIQFCWNVPFTSPPYNKTTNVQPVVTVWMRADLANPYNTMIGRG